MNYRNDKYGNPLSILGFGCLRFPQKFGRIDMEQTEKFAVSIASMTLKTASDSSKPESKINVAVSDAKGEVLLGNVCYTAAVLYQGDGIDLVPSNKKAIVVTAAHLETPYQLTYADDNHIIELQYNPDISMLLGVIAYVAIVDSTVSVNDLENAECYTIGDETADDIIFGDVNDDGFINAQDALAIINLWLRKSSAPTDDQILTANVNGDKRIDTFDALGIVEYYVEQKRDFAVTQKATSVLQ